ncbi:glycosyltransferase [Piscinibacter koreensis]|uniref:Glycosyltransferase n=1 Tax=Piscinibacter koreensis TaxID=2742824 RepID=A0A7Y6TX98_9BURK|nr:glycosyltransferase [Schlegelella koreensis]NUZ06845.1 glycosyltransferase [Schlegelella koreensis]
MLSFIVPAHDEAGSIAAVVASIAGAAQAAGEPHEIVVVDDASTDDTAALASAAGARVVHVDLRHIAATRNAGARAARGDVFVFVDADTLIGPDVVAGVRAALKEGAIGGGAAIRFDEPIPLWVRAVLPASMWFARRLRLTGGCFIFCTRAAFEAVGGFDERLYAAEEIALCRALHGQGLFVILREAVLTSGRKLRTHSMAELIGSGLRVVWAGRSGVDQRARLGVWYGPRRPDDTRSG